MGITGANVRGALGAALGNEGELVRPELVWLKPKLEAAATDIDTAARGSRVVTPPELKAKRTEATGHDGVHDRGHRFVVGAFQLAELALAETDQVARKAVADGRQSLYPEGLDITQKTWSGQGDEALLYEQRLERLEVKAALPHVEAVVPSVRQAIGRALGGGKALGGAVRELAILEAGRQETPQMFAARARGMQVLGLLRSTVDEVYPANKPEHAVVREKLIGAYLSLLEQQDTPSDDEPSADGGATPTPA